MRSLRSTMQLNQITHSSTSKAQSCWALANSYFDAARQLMQHPSTKEVLPTIFLLGHSLELHLKAFLLAHGVSEKKLRELGHNLVASLRECRRRGICNHLVLSRTQIKQIIQIDRYYRRKHLEYFFGNAKRFGSMEELQQIVGSVAKAVFNPITAKDFRALRADS